jgi:hypothetical protein
MRRHLARLHERATVFQVGRDPGAPDGVVALFGGDACRLGPPLHHLPGADAVEPFAGKFRQPTVAGAMFDGLEEGDAPGLAQSRTLDVFGEVDWCIAAQATAYRSATRKSFSLRSLTAVHDRCCRKGARQRPRTVFDQCPEFLGLPVPLPPSKSRGDPCHILRRTQPDGPDDRVIGRLLPKSIPLLIEKFSWAHSLGFRNEMNV